VFVLKIEDVMSHEVLTVSAESNAVEAAKLMQKNNIGALPVVSHGHMVGILTDRDIVMRGVAAGKDPNSLPVSQVMSQPVVCGSPNMDLGAATNLMAEKQVRRLPVVNDGQLIGFVSLGDIAINSPDAVSGDALKDISGKW
jgi:CBS domain-containing protein